MMRKKLENDLTVVKGLINNTEAWMLRDTGSTTTCLSEKLAGELELCSVTERHVTLIDGTVRWCKKVEIHSPY